MNARERFNASIHFLPVDRPFHWETLGMWPETLDRWYGEGLDQSLKLPQAVDFGAMANDEFQRVLVRHFDLDRVDYLRDAVVSGYTDTPFYPPFERQVLEDDGRTRLVRDVDGIVKRELVHYSTSSMPLFIRYPVSTRKDFLDLLPRLDPDSEGRMASNWLALRKQYARRDFPLGLTICGAFGHPRNLLGVEGLCRAYYDQPALVHEIMEHWTDFYIKLSRRVWQELPFDFVLFWEDMAYKGGSLISPKLVKEFMLPYYQEVIDALRSLGCDQIIVDSDGDVKRLIPLFLSVGVNAMLPFEVQAGMDVIELRKQYGKNLAIIGGLDKRTLAQNKEAIDREIKDRMLPMLSSAGYIPCLDHTAPPDVSLELFQYYITQVRKMGSD